MTKRYKWLPYAIVGTGLVVVLLLVLAINSEPLVRWFPIGSTEGAVQESGVAEPESRPTIWRNALGAALITVSILALLSSHLALLFVAANLLNKPQLPAIHKSAVCPRCDRGIRGDWRLCPYCGFTLDPSLNDLANKRQP